MDISMQEMMALQRALWEAHQAKWPPMTPEFARSYLLWIVEELGEVVAIVKKKGDEAIMTDPAVRADFVEEMGDVMMYFIDVLLRYGVTADEFAAAFRAKNLRNLTRDFEGDHKKS